MDGWMDGLGLLKNSFLIFFFHGIPGSIGRRNNGTIDGGEDRTFLTTRYDEKRWKRPNKTGIRGRERGGRIDKSNLSNIFLANVVVILFHFLFVSIIKNWWLLVSCF